VNKVLVGLDVRTSQEAVWRRNQEKLVEATKHYAEIKDTIGKWRRTDISCDCGTADSPHTKIEMLNSMTRKWIPLCPIAFYVFYLGRLAMWGEIEPPTVEQFYALLGKPGEKE
jgi:hypothetical protein